MSKKLVDRRGVEVRCGRVIAQGGEGTIHEIEGRPGFVAKLYHSPPDDDKVAKLAAMIAGRSERLLGIAAWPLEILSERAGGKALGLVLPHIDNHKDVHLLYGPKSRLAAFPLAGWPFLIRAATNLARAFAVVHEHGHVIGDVNDKVALVSERALVKLIDCDSFQIKHGNGVFTCDVGVLTHQPPELQGTGSFRGLKRSTNHDHFGLAVLIFQLLFLARHPFSGSYGKDGDMPLERAIREHRFVYGSEAKKRGMAPPPLALSLAEVTPEMGQMFEAAFSAKRGTRPSASAWVRALETLARRARPCRTNPAHAFLEGRACPFCAIEKQSESALFNLPMPTRTRSGQAATVPINVANLWKEIGAVEAPGPAPALPQDFCALRMHSDEVLRARRRALGAAAVLFTLAALLLPFTGGLSLAMLVLVPPLWPKGGWRSPGSALARRCLSLELRFAQEAAPDPFHERAAELRHARTELEQLEAVHQRRLADLEGRRRDHQLEHFLDGLRIAGAKIAGLSPQTETVLESHGIETAKDVGAVALRKVPALAPEVARGLLTWRKEAEARFRYDPSRPIDPASLAALEREIQQRRADLVQKLADGPVRLRNSALQIEMRRRALQHEVEEVLKERTKLAAAG